VTIVTLLEVRCYGVKTVVDKNGVVCLFLLTKL